MAEKKYPSVHRVCKFCGKNFLVFPYQVAKGEGNYCGLSCAAKNSVAPLAERFWKKVRKTDGCWLWIGGKDRRGYGRIGDVPSPNGRRGPTILASRASWQLHYGPIPDGLDILHRCDNPSCVRPDHLFAGTASDNFQDMLRKGRHPTAIYVTYQGVRMPLTHLAELIGIKKSMAWDCYRRQRLSVEEIVARKGLQ